MINKLPIVINLFGAPGSGKSTGAALVFSKLKQKGINAELVTEFAKSKTWEHNQVALSCQEYIFGNQSYKFARCRNDVDVIVTDSPLPLGILYNNNPALDESFNKTVINVFNSYNNHNYYIIRKKPYNPKGRNQTEEESDKIASRISELLEKYNIPFVVEDGNEEGYYNIVNDVINILRENKINETIHNI